MSGRGDRIVGRIFVVVKLEIDDEVWSVYHGETKLCEWVEEVVSKNNSRCYKLTMMEQIDIYGHCRDMKEWG